MRGAGSNKLQRPPARKRRVRGSGNLAPAVTARVRENVKMKGCVPFVNMNGRVPSVNRERGHVHPRGHPLASLHYVAFHGCGGHARGASVTTNKTGTVVMLKRSAEADTPSLTLPQVPALPRRKSSIHPLLEEQLLEAANTAGKMQLKKLIEIVSSQYDA